jgi:uncharacterized repeat protein (TIGR03803 family)
MNEQGKYMTPKRDRFSRKRGEVPAFFVWLLTLVPFLFLMRSASAQTFTELYPFNSGTNLSDGGWPKAGVVRDAAGNIYGTTFYGGTGTKCDIYFDGCGVVFKLDATGIETVLHSFGSPNGHTGVGSGGRFNNGLNDGWNPTANLTLDAAGNLYGTTPYGGAHGRGVVFKMDTAGNETILHSFAGEMDGANPSAGLVQDASGNLYGATLYGGYGCNGQGCGTVFQLSAGGKETILYRFTGGPDGASPLGGVTLDSSGEIYGTTWLGGIYGFGTIFQLDSNGNEKVLHSFAGGNDGANPIGGLVLDQAGNLYGTTSAGGPDGLGTVYTVDIAGNESILYSFTGGLDGAYPYSNLIVDASGNLYGTASQGGISGTGTVFELSGGSLTVLYGFSGVSDGANSVGGLTADSAGNLYGTVVQAGTNGWGAVFEIRP